MIASNKCIWVIKARTNASAVRNRNTVFELSNPRRITAHAIESIVFCLCRNVRNLAGDLICTYYAFTTLHKIKNISNAKLSPLEVI